MLSPHRDSTSFFAKTLAKSTKKNQWVIKEPFFSFRVWQPQNSVFKETTVTNKTACISGWKYFYWCSNRSAMCFCKPFCVPDFRACFYSKVLFNVEETGLGRRIVRFLQSVCYTILILYRLQDCFWGSSFIHRFHCCAAVPSYERKPGIKFRDWEYI